MENSEAIQDKQRSIISSQVFNFQDFRLLALVDDTGSLWFKAANIARILGYSSPPNAIKRHVRDNDKVMLKVFRIDDNYNNLLKLECHRFGEDDVIGDMGFETNIHPHSVFVNESGLFTLILRSKLPNAESFQQWVTATVLPTLRKTGTYTMDQPNITFDLINILQSEMKALRDDIVFERQRHDKQIEQYSNHLASQMDLTKRIIPLATLPAPEPEQENNFIVFAKNVPSTGAESYEDKFQYYCIRIQTRNLQQKLKEIKKRYPNSEIIYEKRNDPNAVRLYNVAKQTLNLEYSSNHFSTPLPIETLVRNFDMLYNDLLASEPTS